MGASSTFDLLCSLARSKGLEVGLVVEAGEITGIDIHHRNRPNGPGKPQACTLETVDSVAADLIALGARVGAFTIG